MFENSPILRWRKQKQIYRLQGNQCTKCKKLFYPSKYLCSCKSTNFKPFIFSGNGTLLSFTEIKTAPLAFANFSHYLIGMIELEDGPRISSQLVDCKFENLKIGIPVKAVFRKLYSAKNDGIINYGIKFYPCL